MADETQLPHEPSGEDERRLFEWLDRYVDSLHRAGPQDTRQHQHVQPPPHHAELAALLGCLDAVDSLAVSPSSAADVDAPIEQATLVDSSTPPPPAGESADPPPLRQFGKYRLDAELGRGGMGVVYRAWQSDLDRTVAIKMILSSRLASPQDVRRFQSEAKASAGIRHPNIVGIHEVGQVHGQHYFAMDHVEGRSLSRHLAEGPFDGERAARCVAAVARAVHFLHDHNIVHRDLKPSNILIDESDVPYVTDFGLAKVFTGDSAETQTGTIMGTPSYMPPEQAAGRTADISPRSDVYSLGAILYELLCGRPPFKEKTPLDTLVQVLEGEPTILSRLNPHVPRELELICLRCLEKNPEDRYTSADELADDLERFLRDEPIEAKPAGARHALRRWMRREPALVSRWAGLAAAALIVQAAYFYDPTEIDVAYHWRIMATLGAWAAVSFLMQKLLHREDWANAARYAWVASDAVLMTLLLGMTHGPLGPLLIGYPLLVAASGLFFRVPLVWFMTAACTVSYLALLTVHPEQLEPVQYPLIFVAVLCVLGVIVAYQVHRVRVLSRYFERRDVG